MVKYYCMTCDRWIHLMSNYTTLELRALHSHTDLGHKIIQEEKFDLKSYNTMRDSVCLSIEQTLNDFGRFEFDKVCDELSSRFHCTIKTCVGRPDYLKTVLENLYGNSAKAILLTITERIAEHSDDENISNFISVLTH